MRKQFKQILRGTAELTVVFITIFVVPALIGALVNLNTSVYFACVQHPGYCALMTIVGIIFCMVYMSMYQEETPEKLNNEKV
jgi:ABC-type amino acid transport system permease subunit